MRSKRLRPGLIAVSKGLRTAGARARPRLLFWSDIEAAGAVGMRVRLIGWPCAFAPLYSRMACWASRMDVYVTKAVPEERPARSKRRESEDTGPI